MKIEFINILSSSYFLQLAIPLITISMSVFVKHVTRNDSFNIKICKEDFAVGLELLITSLILVIVRSADFANKLMKTENLDENTITLYKNKFATSPWLILMLCITLWGTSTYVRKVGWKDKNKLKLFNGFLFPLIIGVIILLVSIDWISINSN